MITRAPWKDAERWRNRVAVNRRRAELRAYARRTLDRAPVRVRALLLYLSIGLVAACVTIKILEGL